MTLKYLAFIIVVLFASTVFSAEPISGVRADALTLLKTLSNTDLIKTSPEEFASFKSTIEIGEDFLKQGEQLESDHFFSLAILKGKLLQKNAEQQSTVTTPVKQHELALFKKISSARLAPKPATLTQTVAQIEPVIDKEPEPYIEEKISDRIVGGEGVYVVQKKETLRLVASRLGVRVKDLARLNELKRDAMLHPGQRLHYNNRRIVPKSIRNGILVNIPERSLYLFRNGKVAANYPVALGISKKKESTAWRTPVGKFKVVDKKENPAWRIPLSIQKEMEENGEEVLEFMPPGPKNPLGKYALRTTLSGIMIHSTTRPASINSFSSHGCIRVMPEHMENLFRSVSIPMNGEIIYKPVKIEKAPDGRIFLEVNNDSYEMFEDITAEVKKVISSKKLEEKVSWQRVNRVITEKSGIAEDVTLPEMPD
ncbi:MAG: L,D-transpeptidase family protein [Geobacteraceae bacterium]|nr:L,D-transpeptidase family protein [Geobacteraceae bacterium]